MGVNKAQPISTGHRVGTGRQTMEEGDGGRYACGRVGTVWTEGVSGRGLSRGCQELGTVPGVGGRPGHGAALALLGPSDSKDHAHLPSPAVTCSGSLRHRISDTCEREALVPLNKARGAVTRETVTPFGSPWVNLKQIALLVSPAFTPQAPADT